MDWPLVDWMLADWALEACGLALNLHQKRRSVQAGELSVEHIASSVQSRKGAHGRGQRACRGNYRSTICHLHLKRGIAGRGAGARTYPEGVPGCSCCG